MSSTVWKYEKDLCRCCHSEGACVSLYAPYFWLDNEEVVYSKALKECFDIELATVADSSSSLRGICKACILRLQDAVMFKRQVQKCERQFRDTYLLQIDSIFQVDVKEELPDPEDNDFAFANMTGGPINGTIKNDIDSRTSDDERTADEDGTATVRQQDMNFKLEIEVVPIQTITKPKRIRTKTPAAKTKKKKKVTPKKKSSMLPENYKKSENVEGKKKTPYKRPPFPLKEGIDYNIDGDEFQCCRCENVYKTMRSVRGHVMFVHLRIPKHNCSICLKMFHSTSSYVVHKLKAHNIDNRYVCNACDRVFNSSHLYSSHMNGFHKLGVKRKCDKCDYETSSALALRRHKIVHKTEKVHHCTHCSKSFKRAKTLRLHVKIHTGEKNKVCKECGQAFVQKASLNYHMSKHHPGVDF